MQHHTHRSKARWGRGIGVLAGIAFALVCVSLAPAIARADQAGSGSTDQSSPASQQTAPQDATTPQDAAKPPTEAELYSALTRACLGGPADRVAADTLFRRVLRNDTIEPVSTITYPLYGNSQQQIRESQPQSAAQAGLSPGEWGFTHSQWTYRYEPDKGAHITLNTTVTLPQWSGQGDPALSQEWQRFINALEFHEAGHVLVGEYICALLRLRFDAAPHLDAKSADQICKQTNADTANLGALYDQSTLHGILQGALF